MASERSCLICGIAEAEVRQVRSREGYTLGCGTEYNTEDGYGYDELSPRHRWAPWSDRHLDEMGLKPEVFEKYRTENEFAIRYAVCGDQKRGHIYVEDGPDAELHGIPVGTCIACGRNRSEGARP